MSLKVTNPYDQSLVCELAYDDPASLARKLDQAQEAWLRWKRIPLKDRMAQVAQGVQNFLACKGEIAQDVTLQMGKPIGQARNEVNTFQDRAQTMMSIAEETLKPDLLPEKEGFCRRIEHESLGIVFNMAAWNYPLIIPVNVVVPALLAGNVVLLKHSGKTPLCGEAYEKAFSGLEVPHLVTSLVLTHAETARLIQDPKIAHVSFTGSVEGGRDVYRSVSQRFIEAGLELGGKDPAYVAEDADVRFAIDNVVDGVCYNAGQSCCAVERVYVHEKVYEEFVAGALELMQTYKMGDPLDEATTLGPLARASSLQDLENRVKDAVQRGGDLVLGGKRTPGTSGNFFPPTLVTGVPQSAPLMQEEIFGPIMPVLRVASDEEAVQHMNDTRYGLTASVWTSDQHRAERLASELNAGTIFQNRCDYLDPLLPWTGVGESGFGSTLSKYGFYHLTRRKSIHFRVKTR